MVGLDIMGSLGGLLTCQRNRGKKALLNRKGETSCCGIEGEPRGEILNRNDELSLN
jgi:hypothetical protein